MKGETKPKYLVLEWAEIEEHLNKEQREILDRILESLEAKRNLDEKTYDYAVVSMDDRYANEVIEIMKKNNDWR